MFRKLDATLTQGDMSLAMAHAFGVALENNRPRGLVDIIALRAKPKAAMPFDAQRVTTALSPESAALLADEAARANQTKLEVTQTTEAITALVDTAAPFFTTIAARVTPTRGLALDDAKSLHKQLEALNEAIDGIGGVAFTVSGNHQ